MAAPAPRRQRRNKECLPCCAAAKAAKGGKDNSSQGFKGFGESPKTPQKPQRSMTFVQDEEPEPAAAAAAEERDDEQEISLKPCYQMYVDAGYKAQRYLGSLALQRLEGEPLPVLCATQDMLPGDLLLVSPAVGFVEGGFQEVPELEDLHVSMLEDGPSPAQRRVLAILESLRPGPPSTPAAAPAAAASSPASPQAAAVQPLPSLATLDVKFWSGRGRDAVAPEFNSRRLMQLLSRAAASSDSQDPAAMQARHQKPLGYVGVWPEFPLLGHSCAPNTSQLVVADRLFLHLTEELQSGEVLTRNLVGQAITAPLSVRQAAVAEAMAEQGAVLPAAEEGALLSGCRCARCVLEASVSEELRDTLESAYSWFVNEASETWSRANQDEDLAMLRGLLSDCETIVGEVEEAVQGEVGLDDEQQDWLRASVYDVYDLLVTVDELVNQDSADPDYLQTCLELIRVHSPGSDSHMMVALKNESLRHHRLDVFSEMLKRDRTGAKAVSKTDRRKLKALKDATDVAAEFRIEAVILRYGYVTEVILGQLTEGLETYVEGLEQMSVMQAQGMSELTREIEVDGVKVQIVDRMEVSQGARVGAAGGAGGRQVVNQDGMQLVVMDGNEGAAEEEAMGMGMGGDGDDGWEEAGGQVIDVDLGEDEEIDVDAAVQAAVDAALAADIAQFESEGGAAKQ